MANEPITAPAAPVPPAKRATLYDGDTFEHSGYTFRVQFKRDDDTGPPWEECDGHGLSRAAHVWGEVNVFGPETRANGGVDDAAFDAWDGVIYLE